MTSEWPTEGTADNQRSGNYSMYHVHTEDLSHVRNAYPYFKLEEAHALTKPIFSKYAINPKRFSGTRGFTDSDIAADVREVERLDRLFDKSQKTEKMYADVLEAVAFEHGDSSNWFGSNSEIILTSLFDDYMNKIDMVLRTETDGHVSILGLDVTFGSYDLHKKFDKIRHDIDTGVLGKVKYFLHNRTRLQTFACSLDHVPQVVVGVDIQRLKELGLLWMNKKNNQLAKHPVQVLLLEEITMQLRTFADYARAKGKDQMSTILEIELKNIRELLQEKRKAGIATIKDDKVFEEIKRNLLYFTDSGAT